MKDIDYLTFVEECFKHNMIIEELIPVQEEIFKIIDYEMIANGYPLSNISKCIVGESVYKLFKKIVDDKKLDNLSEVVDFVLLLKPSNSFVNDFIETIIYKFPFKNMTRVDYYFIFTAMCVEARESIDEVINYNSKLRIIEIIKKYLYYLNLYIAKGNVKKRPSILSFDQESKEFHNIAVGVMADVYATDLDINILDKFLNSLFYDHDNTMEYLNLNGLLREYTIDYGINNSIEILKLYNEKENNSLLIK